MTGPLDVLDHAADRFTFGGKLGIDATVKLPEEQSVLPDWQNSGFVVLPVNQFNDPFAIKKAKAECLKGTEDYTGKVVLAVDSTVDVSDLYLVAWQILGNSDPVRDAELLDERTLFIDGTIKAYRDGGFARKWPNVVVSAEDTVRKVDSIWNSLGIGKLLLSPSTRYSRLSRPGNDMVIPDS
jgi:4-hydroxy-3-polyprenylbenzoate decarboxylase